MEGSLKLSTTGEFEELLHQNPGNADIQREYADFLSQKKNDENAQQYYNRAADLYIKNGKTLQAIVAKIRAWSIAKPDHQQGRSFHAAIQSGTSAETPLQNFFAAMSYPEFIGIMLRMIRIRFPADQFVVRFGDPGNDIFFVVSGTLEERMHLSARKKGSTPEIAIKFLSDNDIFGEVFPLESFNFSQSDIKTITSVELVRIKKPVLVEILKKHQGIEKLLNRLYKGPGKDKGRSWASVRRTVRHEIPIEVKLKIFHDERHDLETFGFTKDISLGGACIELHDKHWGVKLEDLKDSDVLIQISLPNVNEILEILGKILWSKKDSDSAEEGIIMGIQFRDLSNSDRDFLEDYCFGSDGEQNLIWNLWETYVKA